MDEPIRRKRILVAKGSLSRIEDDMKYRKNKSSDNAKSITTIVNAIKVVLWFDKHYLDRNQHGDENGMREDIDVHTVENLVLRSVKHLIFYSCLVKGFSFLNHYPIVGSLNRIVIQEESNSSMLNVVIQANYISIDELEITVKTAMCIDNFKIAYGQYVLEIQHDSSILKKMESYKMIDVASI